jgi:prepilin-type N-terminal cleavage/methylation domain-containing protein
MRAPRASHQGFTLIEMMITIAIIGIIASIAIPGFQRYQLRSRRSEAMTNLRAIGKMENAYFGEYGVFTPVVAQPAGVPIPAKRAWDPAAEVAYRILGFKAEGAVYYSYDIEDGSLVACACPASTCFTASAYGDLDGDTSVAVVAYYHPDAAGQTCPTAIGGNPVPVEPGTGLVVLDRPYALLPSPGSDDF